MKNVRLFAVAAAMGMFASTVAAAEPTVKESYIATWGEVDEIVKVDVGDKVIAPTATISVVKETRSTDKEEAIADKTFGVGGAVECYVGFTNEVGKDTNNDGYADKAILAMYPNAKADNWYYTDGKFFPTAKTALYYVGYKGGEIYGARFLKPGSAEIKNMYNVGNTDYATVEELVAHYVEEGTIEKLVDAKGNEVGFKYNEVTYTSKVEATKGKTLGTVWTEVGYTNVRNVEELMDEAIVNAMLNGHVYGNADFSDSYGAPVAVASQKIKYTKTVGANPVAPAYFAEVLNADGSVAQTLPLGNNILVVTEDRYGDLVVVETKNTTIVATATDTKAADITVPTDGSFKVVLNVGTSTNPVYSLYQTLKPTAPKAWTMEKEYYWDVTGSFVGEEKVYELTAPATIDVDTVFGEDLTSYDADLGDAGLVQYVAPANTSDKIVINTWGTGLNLTISGINSTKGYMTLVAPDTTEYTVSAVKLDGKWYPAVDTEEELVEFVNIFAGLHTPTDADDQKAWTYTFGVATGDPATYPNGTYGAVLAAEGVTGNRTLLDGTVVKNYMPKNGKDHYYAKQCTYKVSEGTEVVADVTSNADAIDTNEAGVKTLTLTAKVGEEVVGTKEVKVVVAPKYERVYKNGKVVKLTAKWLNGNTYAVYNYDWAAKTYTATFYAQDGVTVAGTSNGSL